MTKEQKAAYARWYRQSTPERKERERQQGLKWRARNRERLREYHRKWSAEHRDAVNERSRKEYWRDPEKAREIANVHASVYRKRKHQLIIEAKSKPCTDCHISYPFFVMDLDHIRGEKLIEFGTHEGSIEAVKAEIEKCDPVCANCHRIRTWYRKLAANT